VPVSAPVIRVQHLTHRFGSNEVLHDIGFEVGRAEIFGFIGPNGAGKTTTIRAMATLLEPSSGRIEIDGIDVGLEPERVRSKIGFMGDNAGVYAKLTVDEFLAFFAAAYRLDVAPAVERALELTDLGASRDELTGTLSKGTRQRLQLAKTLLHDPDVLVLDEPASGLDPRARIEMRDLFVRLRAAGKTIFLSSHILTELSDVCTSVGILEKGHLLAYGPIAEIAQRLGRREPAVESPVAASRTETTPKPPRRAIKLRTLDGGETARTILEAEPEVFGVHASGDQTTFQLAGDDRVLAELVKRLVRAGVGVVGVEPERDKLEAVFLELTKKGDT
jgi:ABC-2 type transport system ATP-binding protein